MKQYRYNVVFTAPGMFAQAPFMGTAVRMSPLTHLGLQMDQRPDRREIMLRIRDIWCNVIQVCNPVTHPAFPA